MLSVYVLICSNMFKFHRNGCVPLSEYKNTHTLLNPLEQNVPVLWDTELCPERLFLNMSSDTERAGSREAETLRGEVRLEDNIDNTCQRSQFLW